MKFAAKLLKSLLITAALLFAGTFTIYYLNLENKLIYKVIYPPLQKHYNSQQRDRRICKEEKDTRPPAGILLCKRRSVLRWTAFRHTNKKERPCGPFFCLWIGERAYSVV